MHILQVTVDYQNHSWKGAARRQEACPEVENGRLEVTDPSTHPKEKLLLIGLIESKANRTETDGMTTMRRTRGELEEIGDLLDPMEALAQVLMVDLMVDPTRMVEETQASPTETMETTGTELEDRIIGALMEDQTPMELEELPTGDRTTMVAPMVDPMVGRTAMVDQVVDRTIMVETGQTLMADQTELDDLPTITDRMEAPTLMELEEIVGDLVDLEEDLPTTGALMELQEVQQTTGALVELEKDLRTIGVPVELGEVPTIGAPPTTVIVGAQIEDPRILTNRVDGTIEATTTVETTTKMKAMAGKDLMVDGAPMAEALMVDLVEVPIAATEVEAQTLTVTLDPTGASRTRTEEDQDPTVILEDLTAEVDPMWTRAPMEVPALVGAGFKEEETGTRLATATQIPAASTATKTTAPTRTRTTGADT